MKTIKTIFIAIFLMTTVGVNAQSVDDILNKHISAMGGIEKLNSLKTVKMEGNLNVQGTDVAIVMTTKHQEGLRMDMEIMGSSNYQLANKTKGWVFMPIMGQTEPQEMTPDQFSGIANQFDIRGALVDYKAKGITVELVGDDKVDNNDAFKLKVTRDGKVTHMFVDAKTFFVLKSTSKVAGPEGEVDMESVFADYKQNADGYWFPYSITSSNGTIVFDKISTNVAVDNKLFEN
ncbi:MAG: hypothetical protein WD135_00305 [Ferruginibacter sp.]